MGSPSAADTLPDVLQQTRAVRGAGAVLARCLAVPIHTQRPPRDFGGQYLMNPRSPADTPLYKVGESNQHNRFSYCAAPQQLWSTHSYAKPQNSDVHIRFSATSLQITRTRALHDTNPTGT